jgi:putative spermidine/putrescine transport system permease protein
MTTGASDVRGKYPVIRTRRGDPFRWLAVPALLYLCIMFALPLAMLFATSLHVNDGWGFSNYIAFFFDPYNWRVLGNTLRIAFLVTLVCLGIGLPVAFGLARAKGSVQVVLLVAMILPLSVGVVVKAFSWQIILRSDGAINKALVALHLSDRPIHFLFTEMGLVIGATNIFLPFMVLPIYSVVRLIDPALDSAAATLGAGPIFRFFRVTLPLAMPGVIAGIAFVFSFSTAMYVIPTLLIGDRFQTLSTLMARAYLTLREQGSGSAIGVILLVIALAVVLASGLLSRTNVKSG